MVLDAHDEPDENLVTISYDRIRTDTEGHHRNWLSDAPELSHRDQAPVPSGEAFLTQTESVLVGAPLSLPNLPVPALVASSRSGGHNQHDRPDQSYRRAIRTAKWATHCV